MYWCQNWGALWSLTVLNLHFVAQLILLFLRVTKENNYLAKLWNEKWSLIVLIFSLETIAIMNFDSVFTCCSIYSFENVTCHSNFKPFPFIPGTCLTWQQHLLHLFLIFISTSLKALRQHECTLDNHYKVQFELHFLSMNRQKLKVACASTQ